MHESGAIKQIKFNMDFWKIEDMRFGQVFTFKNYFKQQYFKQQ